MSVKSRWNFHRCHAGIPEKKNGIKLKYKVRNSKKSKLSNKKQKNTWSTVTCMCIHVWFSPRCCHRQLKYFTDRKLKYRLKRDYLEKIYLVFIRPILEYASEVWDNCGQANCNCLEKIQIEAAHIQHAQHVLARNHLGQCFFAVKCRWYVIKSP
jgi:hypothetical protein